MQKTKTVFLPLSSATYPQLKALRNHCNPFNNNAIPSIVRLWEEDPVSSVFYVTDKYSLIYFKEQHEDNTWIIGSKQPLSKSDWLHVKESITSYTGDTHPVVKFLSDAMLTEEARQEYIVQEMDEGYFDYIYDCHEQATCAGGKFEDMRRQTRIFFKQYGLHTKIDVNSTVTNSIITKESVLHLFDDWLEFGTDGSKDSDDELRALSTFFDKSNRKFFGELVIIRFFYKNKLVAFSVSELLDDFHAINHFHKTNLNLSGISYYTFFSMMEVLNQKGVKYLNFQEDVGIPGLRAFKLKMRPAVIDKRYSIQL